MELLLKINCSDEQISYLTSVFDDTPVALAKREDGPYLRSKEIVEDEFDKGDSELISESWEQARTFIARTNGAAMLEKGTPTLEGKSWAPISLENMKVVLQDGDEEWFPITGSAYLTSGRRKSASAKGLLKSAGESVHVAKALRLQCQDMDWVNLYRLLEVIREDVGGDDQIDRNGWAKKDDINKFTGSANNSSVIGDEARHGTIDGSGQPSEIMTLREARRLVRNIVLQWIEAKTSSI